MNKLGFTIKKGPRIYPVKRIQFTLLLLVLVVGFSTVSMVQADLPPETYYQGMDTGVNGDDVGSAALPIGFDFTFFGNTYNQFYVSSNGFISFSSIPAWIWTYNNRDIANGNLPNNYIAPFWDDTTVINGADQNVYYKTIGSAPNRQLIVQFTNVGFWSDPTPLGTFFVILHEGNNNIQLQYRYLVGNNSRTRGGSATVGLENVDGSEGSKYSFNTESLASEQVILFTPNGSNYDISTAPYLGVLLGAGATQSPDIPTQTTPLNGSTVSTTPTFSWGASANADSYELRIDNNANMGSLTLNPTGIIGTSFTPTSPLPIDTYYWIVIAHNADDSTWSEQWTFTTSNNPPPPLPGVPLLTSPTQDETEVAVSPTFSWQTASSADSYQLLVSEQPDLSAPIIDQSGIISPTTSFNASGLSADTLYYWAVVASNVTGNSQSATRSFTTLHINTAPIANDDSHTVGEDSGTTQIDVLVNDSDPDTGDTLSISSVGATDNGGTAVINSNQIDYTPALNFAGTEVFTYTASDGNGGSDTATVTVTVTGSNDDPTANDDSDTVGEDSGTTQIDVLANDTDPDAGDILSISVVGATDNGGTAVINSNQIDYTPALNFAGTEVFTYTINDGNGGSDTATVTITVTGSNDSPTANDDSDTVGEDSGTTQVDVLANDTDPDVGDVLSISTVGTTDNGGTAVLNTNQVDYTPALNFAGIETFTYTVGDGNGGSDTATVTITVTASNDAPTANDDSDAVGEDSGTTQIDVLANDTDPDAGDILSISSVGSTNNGGTAVINSNQVDYTPALNFAGTETFTYTVSDGNGGSGTATVTVTVTENPVNDEPIANDDSDTAVEDSATVQIDVLANDTDPDTGDILSISVVGATDNGGTAVINSSRIDYTPALNFAGTEVFTYTISDGSGGNDSATVTITVSGSNDAPTAYDDIDSVGEDSATTQIDVLANDTDPDTGDTLSISSVGATDNGGTAVLNTNQVDYTPALNFAGIETFTYTVSDGNGGSDTATVTITVSGSNDAPTANDDSDTVVEDSSTTQIDVLANDTDPDAGDILTISNVGTTDNGGTAVLNSNQIDYTPAQNFVGSEVFTYTISDGNGGSDTATVTVTVTDNLINDEPIANDDSDTVVEDSATAQIDVLANDTDPDAGDTLSITNVGATDNGGTAVINSTQIDYTPALNFAGTEVFTYTLSDGNGGSDTATVTITVSGSNDAPTANDDSDTVVEDSSTTQIDVLANDTDPDAGDILSISSIGGTDNGGTAVINSNQIDYTPALNFAGTEVFTYTVSDGSGSSDTATVTITVTASNDAPTANDDSDSVVEDSATTQIDVLANDTDPDAGDILTISGIGAADSGGTVVTNSSLIDYTPAQNFVGTEVFTYTVSDGNGSSDTATVSVTVTDSPINDTPTAYDDARTVIEDSGTVQIDVLVNDSDPDTGDTLSISSVGATDNGGTAVINSNQIDYTPTLNFVGTEIFTYTITDGNGGSDTATVTINVGGSNDAPDAQDDTPETLEDTAVTIDVLNNDTDPDGDTLTITDAGVATNGAVAIQGNRIKYTPQLDFYGTDTFTYTLSDGEFTDVATVTVTVIPVNDLPQAAFDSLTIQAGSSVTIHVLDNDQDPVENSTLTIISVADPTHGTATTDGTVINYTPDAGFTGTEQFDYTISDGTDTANGTVAITINPYQVFLPMIINK